jgi:hypothetical protein
MLIHSIKIQNNPAKVFTSFDYIDNTSSGNFPANIYRCPRMERY